MSERAESAGRSPLNLVVLALLFEAPMHPYRMHKLIRDRGKDEVVNVRSRNSVQQTVSRLERVGLIEVTATDQEGNYPQRSVYALTAAGREELLDSLRYLLTTPAREFPLFPAALSLMAITSVESAAGMLRQRREELSRTVSRKAESLETDAARLPRILLIENDYIVAMQEAEIAWIDRTLDAIAAGTLTWHTQRLVDEASRYER